MANANNRKKTLIMLLAIVAGVVFCFTVLPWLLLGVGSLFLPSPLTPQIKYGEFPFRLEYEVNGESFVVEDTVICEYDGIGLDEGRGKHRKWKSYLATSGREDLIILRIDDNRSISCATGTPEYYMGDLPDYVATEPFEPIAIAIEGSGRNKGFRRVRSDELFEQYKIKLISWEFSDPIVNSFPEK